MSDEDRADFNTSFKILLFGMILVFFLNQIISWTSNSWFNLILIIIYIVVVFTVAVLALAMISEYFWPPITGEELYLLEHERNKSRIIANMGGNIRPMTYYNLTLELDKKYEEEKRQRKIDSDVEKKTANDIL